VRFHAIVDEGVLYRIIGDRGVTRAQLASLVELSQLPNVTLQVLPFAAGSHPGLDGSFSVLTFAGSFMPETAYAESQLGQYFRIKPKEVDHCKRAFARMSELAADPSQSLTIIEERVRALS
jgi:hypothetical protein